jgi:hypothetical protein
VTDVLVKGLVAAMDDLACQEVDNPFDVAISQAIDGDAPVDQAL